MLATSIEELKALLPARVQKVSVDREGSLTFELYVHPRSLNAGSSPHVVEEMASGAKRWLSITRGALHLVEIRPAQSAPTTETREPPAIQGLLRKELVPSALALLDVQAAIDDDVLVLGLTFIRSQEKPRVLVLEHTTDPRSVLCLATEDGLRVLGAIGGAPRPEDGRDLRRGRLYEGPRAPQTAKHEDAPAARAPTDLALGPALAAVRSGMKAESRRLRRLVEALRADLLRHGDASRHEEEGELLKTRLAGLTRGAASVEVEDWSGSPRTIALDPALDARGNLQLLFKRARRAREAAKRTAPRLSDAERRLSELEALRARLAAAVPTPIDVEAARRLLERPEMGGSARRKAARGGRRQPWRAFRVARDVVVRVGRGARDNDALVKSARGNDLWLHARGHQGAHVVVPSMGEEIPLDVMSDAGLLAAHFSSARGERHVDVQTARVKHLRKPGPKAPAGLVHVTRETVVPVRLDEARLAALLASEVPAS